MLQSTKIVFIDLETTGMRSSEDRILEIGALKVHENKIVGRYEQLVNPEVHVEYNIEKLTGIRNEDVRTKPTFADIHLDLKEFMDDDLLIAHNAKFDISFLKAEYSKLGLPLKNNHQCSVEISRSIFPEERSHSLDAIMARYDLRCERRHRAFDDAEAVYNYFRKIGLV